MRSLRHDILFGLVMCLIAVVVALAWGSPFVVTSPVHAQDTDRAQQVLLLKVKPHPGVLRSAANR